jgi:hypothetical protein
MRLKSVVLFLLGAFVAASVLVLIFDLWLRKSPVSTVASPQAIASTANVSETEQILKEKLDNYSKRADDLQKLISILLGISTIYAAVLAISAYTSVQSNLRQTEKEIDRLKQVIIDQEVVLTKNRDAVAQMQQEIREAMNYSTRISIGRLVTVFPFEGTKEQLRAFRHEVIKRLVETRSGRYSTDSYLNFLISRSYKLLDLHQSAEEVMTSFISEKEKAKEIDDDLRDAYYNRACYQGLRWSSAAPGTRVTLQSGIERDLIRVFSLDESYRSAAQTDPDFTDVLATDWFKRLAKL